MTGQLILELAPPPLPTFENFVPGRNRAAIEALRALSAGPRSEQVVYLWGKPGSGRTHLLEGAVHAARAAGKAAAVLRSGTELSRQTTVSGVLLLAIDDIDGCDAAAQISAFDAFNTVRGNGGAFVAAGNASPQRLAVREDLRTRLGSGLVFELLPLSEAEKRTALHGHAAARGMALGDEVIGYLLTRVRRDLGTQLAVLDALDRYSLAHKRAVTLPLVREAIAALALR